MHDRIRQLWEKPSTLGRYAIVSAIPIILFGMALSYPLTSFVEKRTLEGGAATGEVLGRVASQGLTPRDVSPLGDNARWLSLQEAIADSALGADGHELRVYSPDLELIYSSDARISKLSFEIGRLERALDGQTVPYRRDVEGMEEELVVVSPISGNAPGARGVIEISVPYAPKARAIKQDFVLFYVVLLIGLNLLFWTLFYVAVKASRNLRNRAAEHEHLALHDVLTGLANRALFRDRVKQALRLAEREKQTLAILLMDLDRFKEINDTLGHHNGDLVLQETARRLKHTLRGTDTISRLGGDEFAMLIPNVPDPAAIMHVAHKIKAALNVPFILQGLSLEIRPSIGVAFYPGHGKDVDILMQRADVAMYLAKAAQTGCEIYAVEKDEYSPSRLALVGELRNALDNEEFVVYYQPKVEMRSGQVRGVEALLRWDHPLRRTIPPGEFIPLAEHTGLIEPLTMFVLNEALKQTKRWLEAGIQMRVAVNLSGRSLLDPDFCGEVTGLLKVWQVPPQLLQFEITEPTLLADPERAAGVMAMLNRHGVDFSLDDFGTGNSSLVALRRLPLKELKIDKSFVLNMDVDENDAVIVRSLVDLGRNLGLQVVAEGVETEAVWHRLAEMGCDYAQGFFNSRPMPAEQLTRWLHVMSQPPLG